MRRSDFIFYILIVYVFSAGIWWSYLLHTKNTETFEARKIALRYMLQKDGMPIPIDFEQTAEYQQLEQTYHRKQLMIYGEGSVLFVLLLIGFWYVHRSKQKELAIAQQQRNFLLSVTHELKSPLASIQLGLETVQRRALSQEQLHKIANHALRDTKRLHQLIQNLLLATRVETGYSYHFNPVDLVDLLERCIEQLRPLFAGEMLLNAPDTPIEVQGDATTLPSVFTNLIENAIKYAPQSPQIVVNIGIEGHWAKVEVCDQGRGIPKNEKTRIFDKFYRIGNEETRKSQGTGLGLFIVKQVTEAHGGKITVGDNTPTGTVFQVLLPA